jgi:REP element-mobilizing transposase RayT
MYNRDHPVHQTIHEHHGRSIIVFVTVCTKSRKRILADPVIHKHLVRSWKMAETWLVGRYVIMPDHVHLFCAPAELHPMPLLQWVSYWKSTSARNWPNATDFPIWQRHFWDTQLRRGENYDQKWEYVGQNPVRAGLAGRLEDWPFQGELNSLRW